MDEAVRRVTGDQLAQLMFPRFGSSGDAKQLTQGMNASPGRRRRQGGLLVGDRRPVGRPGREGRAGPARDQPRRPVRDDRRRGRADQPRRQDLARRRGRPRHGQDLRLRRRGAAGRHQEEAVHGARTAPSSSEGDVISIDGSTGRVWLGEVPVEAPAVVRYFEGEIAPDSDDADDLVRSVHRILTHADEKRRLAVRTNADTPEDSARARRFGAQGIGLCRTEHMFLGDRRQLVETLILAEDEDERNAALDAAGAAAAAGLPRDLRGDGRPADDDPAARPAAARVPARPHRPRRCGWRSPRSGASTTRARCGCSPRCRRCTSRTRCSGLRGVRLGLVVPGLFTMQVRAIAEAAAERKKAGGDPRPEIMIPLVGAVQELEAIREEAVAVLAEVAEPEGVDVPRHDRHDDRGAARGAHRRGDRRGGRLLLLRHQRPHPDDLGLLPRRRRGGVLPRLPGHGHLRGLAVRVPRHRRASAG